MGHLDQLRMLLPQPLQNLFTQVLHQLNQVPKLRGTDRSYPVILDNVTLAPAGVEKIGVTFSGGPENQRECLNSPVVLKVLFSLGEF